MKNLKKILSMSLLILIVIVLLPNNINEVQAAKPKLNTTTLTMSKGDTFKLKLQNNKSKIKWSSSNKKIVAVNSSGKLTAKTNGVCKIYAKVGSKKYTCNVMVSFPQLNNESVQMSKGSIYQLALNNATGKITWYSSNKSIATVESDGKIKAIETGIVQINAFYKGEVYICNVAVIGNKTLLYSDENVNVYYLYTTKSTDKYADLYVTFRFDNKSNQKLEIWNYYLSINYEQAEDGFLDKTISSNSSATVTRSVNIDKNYVNVNNLNITTLSGEFYYQLNGDNTNARTITFQKQIN